MILARLGRIYIGIRVIVIFKILLELRAVGIQSDLFHE